MAFERAKLQKNLADLAAKGVFIGTSSWKYPGWRGMIYDESKYITRGKFSESRFERDCLTEYAETFKTVCVDAGYYRFPDHRYVEKLVSQVPSDFLFTFKVTDEITVKKFTNQSRYGERAGKPNKNFLNSDLFGAAFVNPQLYGYGMISRGEKVDGQRGEDIWGWCHPILIPYFDAEGEILHLRPHKGGLRGNEIRLYVVRRRKEYMREVEPAEYAMIGEGEFKGLALAQVLGAGVEIAMLPGITTSKKLFGDMEDWLAEALPDANRRQVVVSFDNEEKGDSELPGYNEDPTKRFDSQIWARYAARELSKQGYDGKVCLLPESWRNSKGKADWDGALAQLIENFLKGMEGREVQRPASTDAQWLAVRNLVRTEFIQVIRSAETVSNQWQLFDTETERIIQNGLEQISCRPCLPYGTDDEEQIARRLQRVVRKLRGQTTRLNGRELGFLFALSKRYQELKGRYYVLKPLSEKKMLEWEAARGRARSNDDVEVKRVVEVALLGMPEAVSDFYMKCHHRLLRPNGTDYIVTLVNVSGRETRIALSSEFFAQPTEFRKWLLRHGCVWKTGERPLNELQEDITRESARLEVEEVNLRGYHAASRAWFWDDVAYTADGRELRVRDPGKKKQDGILWIDGQGYKLGERDAEDQEFSQIEKGAGSQHCLLHPNWPARAFKGDKRRLGEEEAVKLQFEEVSEKLFETLGSYAAFMVLGILFAFGAGPEIYKMLTAFPGLWVHGETKQGKSSLVRWLMRIWGFKISVGMPLADSTKAGLSIVMQQYGDLPVWLEEIQPDAPKWLIEKLKNFYGRESGVKMTVGENEKRRVVRASAIVTGISTSNNPQLRSRYAHVLVSAKNRKASHFNWFEENSDDFYQFGRFILRRRAPFAEETIKILGEWNELPEMKNADPRARTVHGVAFAGFTAFARLCGNPIGRSLLEEFRVYLIQHCLEQIEEVDRQVNVNQFWTDVLAALEADAFGRTTTDRRRLFKVMEVKPGQAPLRVLPEYQLETVRLAAHKDWKHWILYFQPEAVINAVREYRKRIGGEAYMDRSDLRAQMKTRAYWLPPKGIEHRQRFDGTKGSMSCWGILLDFHELGYLEPGQEAWDQSLHPDGDLGVGVPSDEWVDPRRGDLFALVDSLTVKEDKA